MGWPVACRAEATVQDSVREATCEGSGRSRWLLQRSYGCWCLSAQETPSEPLPRLTGIIEPRASRSMDLICIHKLQAKHGALATSFSFLLCSRRLLLGTSCYYQWHIKTQSNHYHSCLLRIDRVWRVKNNPASCQFSKNVLPNTISFSSLKIPWGFKSTKFQTALVLSNDICFSIFRKDVL